MKGSSLAAQSRFIRSAHQTLHLHVANYFGLSEFLLLERNFHSLEDCRSHLEELSAPKDNKVRGPWNVEIT
jgi:hypothetical protein